MQPRMTISFRSQAEADLFRAAVYANAARDGSTVSETVVGAVLGTRPFEVPEDVGRELAATRGVPRDADDVMSRNASARMLAEAYRDAHAACLPDRNGRR